MSEMNEYGYYIYQAAAKSTSEENKPGVVFLPDGTMWFPHVIETEGATARPNIYVIREIDGSISPTISDASQVNPGGTWPHIIYRTETDTLALTFEYNQKIYYREFDSSYFTGSLTGALQETPRPLVDCIQVDDGGDDVLTTNFSIAFDRLSAPENLSGSNFLVSTFTLSWDSVTSDILAGYNLYYGSGASKTKINGLLITDTEYVGAPLYYGIPYYVTAVSTSSTESDYSAAYTPTELETQSYKFVDDGQYRATITTYQTLYSGISETETVGVDDGTYSTLVTTLTLRYLHKTEAESKLVQDGRATISLSAVDTIEI